MFDFNVSCHSFSRRFTVVGVRGKIIPLGGNGRGVETVRAAGGGRVVREVPAAPERRTGLRHSRVTLILANYHTSVDLVYR